MQTVPDLFVGVASGLLSALLFSAQNVVFKSQKEHITPADSNAIKVWVCLAFTAVVVFLPLRASVSSISLDSMFFLAVSVLFGAAFGDLAYLNSQNRVGVAVAFPIAHSYPVITYLFSVMLLGEGFSVIRLIGVALVVVGIIPVSRNDVSNGKPDAETKGSVDRAGLALAALTSVMLSVSAILIQVGVSGIDAIDGNLVRMFFGSLVMLPIFVGGRISGKPLPSRRVSKVIILASLFGFSIGSLFWVASIKYAGATISAVVGSIAPIFALPMSISGLKERVRWSTIAGTLVATLGVVLAVIVV